MPHLAAGLGWLGDVSVSQEFQAGSQPSCVHGSSPLSVSHARHGAFSVARHRAEGSKLCASPPLFLFEELRTWRETHKLIVDVLARSRRSSSMTRQAAERERFVSHWIGGTAGDNDTLNLRPNSQEELFREVLLRAQGAYTAFLEPDSSSSQGVSIRMVHVAPCTGSGAFFSHTATRQT